MFPVSSENSFVEGCAGSINDLLRTSTRNVVHAPISTAAWLHPVDLRCRAWPLCTKPSNTQLEDLRFLIWDMPAMNIIYILPFLLLLSPFLLLFLLFKSLDPEAVRKLPGRWSVTHLKDYQIHLVAVTVNWVMLLSAARMLERAWAYCCESGCSP